MYVLVHINETSIPVKKGDKIHIWKYSGSPEYDIEIEGKTHLHTFDRFGVGAMSLLFFQGDNMLQVSEIR